MADAPALSGAPAGDDDLEAEVRRLVRELQAGTDPEPRFRRLFDLYYRPVYHLFLRRGMSREESLDLTQDTFLRVYVHIGQFHFGSSFKTWLLEIAMNTWRNRLRHQLAQRRRSSDEVSFEETLETGRHRQEIHQAGGAPEEDPLGELLNKEQRWLLRAQARNLPPQMRQCFLMALQGRSYPEIARALQIEVNTVKSQMFQARQRLREELAGHRQPLSKEGPGLGGA